VLIKGTVQIPLSTGNSDCAIHKLHRHMQQLFDTRQRIPRQMGEEGRNCFGLTNPFFHAGEFAMYFRAGLLVHTAYYDDAQRAQDESRKNLVHVENTP
jgi:hypothetical protein